MAGEEIDIEAAFLKTKPNQTKTKQNKTSSKEDRRKESVLEGE